MKKELEEKVKKLNRQIAKMKRVLRKRDLKEILGEHTMYISKNEMVAFMHGRMGAVTYDRKRPEIFEFIHMNGNVIESHELGLDEVVVTNEDPLALKVKGKGWSGVTFHPDLPDHKKDFQERLRALKAVGL